MDSRIKKTLLIAFAAGAGVAVVIAALAGGAYWYLSRPKPWDTTALVADGPPGINLADDGKKIRFKYSLENKTDSDYRISSGTEIKIVVKYNDNSLSQPMPTEVASVEFPVFVPTKQAAVVALDISFAAIPPRKESETDEQYNEVLRAYYIDRMKDDRGFVLFDDLDRYEINLPKPAAQTPKKVPQQSP